MRLLFGWRLLFDEGGEVLGVGGGVELFEFGEVGEGGFALAEGGAGEAGEVVRVR